MLILGKFYQKPKTWFYLIPLLLVHLISMTFITGCKESGEEVSEKTLNEMRKGLNLHVVIDQALTTIQLEPVNSEKEIIFEGPARPNQQKLFYKVEKEPSIQGSNILSAKKILDEMNSTVIQVSFNPAGAKELEQTTSKHTGEQLAIVFKTQVLTAPVIQGKIEGGKIQITGASIEEMLKLMDGN